MKVREYVCKLPSFHSVLPLLVCCGRDSRGDIFLGVLRTRVEPWGWLERSQGLGHPPSNRDADRDTGAKLRSDWLGGTQMKGEARRGEGVGGIHGQR